MVKLFLREKWIGKLLLECLLLECLLLEYLLLDCLLLEYLLLEYLLFPYFLATRQGHNFDASGLAPLLTRTPLLLDSVLTGGSHYIKRLVLVFAVNFLLLSTLTLLLSTFLESFLYYEGRESFSKRDLLKI